MYAWRGTPCSPVRIKLSAPRFVGQPWCSCRSTPSLKKYFRDICFSFDPGSHTSYNVFPVLTYTHLFSRMLMCNYLHLYMARKIELTVKTCLGHGRCFLPGYDARWLILFSLALKSFLEFFVLAPWRYSCEYLVAGTRNSRTPVVFPLFSLRHLRGFKSTVIPKGNLVIYL